MPPNGFVTNSIFTPNSKTITAAAIWPSSLCLALSSALSSAMPRATVNAPPIRSPNVFRSGRPNATVAMRNAAYMATPPRNGTGSAWICRPLGRSTMPRASAIFLISGVRSHEHTVESSSAPRYLVKLKHSYIKAPAPAVRLPQSASHRTACPDSLRSTRLWLRRR